jgi:hypothetical protein
LLLILIVLHPPPSIPHLQIRTKLYPIKNILTFPYSSPFSIQCVVRAFGIVDRRSGQVFAITTHEILYPRSSLSRTMLWDKNKICKINRGGSTRIWK